MTIKNDDDDMPLTRGDLKEFCALLCEGLAPHRTGDLVPAHMIKELHSDSPVEYDQTIRVRLFDLYDGRTGIERDDGLIYYAD